MQEYYKTGDGNCSYFPLCLCNTCYRKISKIIVPAESIINNLEHTRQKDVLKNLVALEKNIWFVCTFQS